MAKEYVQERDGEYSIKGTRVSLDSVVCAFLRGDSPEGIGESFPALTLEQIFGAITFYLAHRAAVDKSLRQSAVKFESLRKDACRKSPNLYSKLSEARQKSNTSNV